MGLPKYIVNFDELTESMKIRLLDLIENQLDGEYPQLNTNNLEAILESIKKSLPYVKYVGLKNIIDDFVFNSINGIQKVEGRLIDVAPKIKENIEEFIFEKDIYLTGLHFNQTGWKKNDRYTLEVDKKKIINCSYTKEIGEHKHFNTFLKVLANTPISFILDNKSGNSRQTMVDLEYIESVVITPPVPDPNIPSIDDIPNDWDVAVVMNWVENSLADMDLHGFIGSNHIYFSNRSQHGMYLNFDYTSHIGNANPEIISVKGHKNESLEIYVHNYKATSLTKPVNIKIYHKGVYGNNLLKEFNINVENNKSYLLGVCSINLNTLEITTLNKKINTINGGI